MSRAALLAAALLAAGAAGCVEHARVAPLDYGPSRLAAEEAFRAQAPVAAPVIPRVPIAHREARLENGVRLIHVERPALPLVTARLVIDRGAVDLDAGDDAYAILRRLVAGGTASQKGAELAESWAKLGAAHGVMFGADGAALWAKVESSDLDAAVALLAEMAARPRLVDRSVEGARAAFLGDVMNARFSTGASFARNTAALLFGGRHAYGYVRRDPAAVRGLGAADFGALHARLFRPEHATLIVVGDARADLVDAIAARRLGAWSSTPSAAPLPRVSAPPPVVQGPRVILCDTDDFNETNVQIVARGPAAGDPDVVVLELIARALGGISAALRGDMREERGAAYSFGADVSRMRLASTLSVGGSLAAARAMPALRAMLDAIAELGNRGLGQAELDRARAGLMASWRSTVSTTDGLSAVISGFVVSGQPLSEIADAPARLSAVTPADVQRVARRYLGAGALGVVVLGHRGLRAELEALGLGPVERRDNFAAVVR